MWETDNRLIVSPKRNYKIPENIWYFKTGVNTMSTYTTNISTKTARSTSKILLHKFMMHMP